MPRMYIEGSGERAGQVAAQKPALHPCAVQGGRAMRSTLSPRSAARLRAWIAIALVVVWIVVAASGWLLWLAPEGQRSGQIQLFLGLTKRQWGDVHFAVSIVATLITIVHVVVDWRALRGCVRHLTSSEHRLQHAGD